jgi:hypothetical protein
MQLQPQYDKELSDLEDLPSNKQMSMLGTSLRRHTNKPQSLQLFHVRLLRSLTSNILLTGEGEVKLVIRGGS